MASPKAQHERNEVLGDGLGYYPFFHDNELFFNVKVQRELRKFLGNPKAVALLNIKALFEGLDGNLVQRATPRIAFDLLRGMATGELPLPARRTGETIQFNALEKLVFVFREAIAEIKSGGSTWQTRFLRWRADRYMRETSMRRHDFWLARKCKECALRIFGLRPDVQQNRSDTVHESGLTDNPTRVIGSDPLPEVRVDGISKWFWVVDALAKMGFKGLTEGAIRTWITHETKRRDRRRREWFEADCAYRELEDPEGFRHRKEAFQRHAARLGTSWESLYCEKIGRFL